jgi:hypothetical protein
VPRQSLDGALMPADARTGFGVELRDRLDIF